MPITEGFMESVFNSNIVETKEQIMSNITFVICFMLVLFVYIYQFFKLEYKTISKKIRFLFIGLFLGLNIVLFLAMLKFNLTPKKTFQHHLSSAVWSWQKKYQKVYPANIIFHTISLTIDKRKMEQLEKEISHFRFNTKKKTKEKELIILVIGETARYSQFGIHCYERNTTPKLAQLNNLISFSDVYTQANLTSLSVPQIITRANPENFELQYKEKTIVEAFKEGGYYTAWFGNQGAFLPIVKRLKSIADYSYFPSVPNDFDGAILPHLKKIISANDKPKFIVIHTWGSHFRYSARYPKNFEVYQPNLEPTGYNMGIENKQKMINSYDNSILYTDYFLNEIIQYIKHQNLNSSLVYLSDHGENLYEDDSTHGHGSENPTEEELHIPLFIWNSDEYIKSNPNKIKYLHHNIDKKATTESIFYTLFDLGNIESPKVKKVKTFSLSSADFTPPEKRKFMNANKEVLAK